jgi:WD40 repeat protein
MAFSPDSRLLAAGDDAGNAHIWDYLNKSLRVLACEHGSVSCVSFAPDGTTIITAGKDNCIKFWDLSSGQLKLEVSALQAPITCLAVLANPNFVVTADEAGWLKVWDSSTGRLVAEKDIRTEVTAITVLPAQDRVIAGTMRGMIFVWEVS